MPSRSSATVPPNRTLRAGSPRSRPYLHHCGEWKQCDQGQVFDLDAMGMWEQSTAIPKLRYLKVGKNNYQTNTGTNGVHFMVGVQEARDGSSPIFVDPAETGHGMTALYQPQEKVQWWYQSGMHTSTIIGENVGPVETGDFTPPDAVSGTNSNTSSYNFQAGQWTTTSP